MRKKYLVYACLFLLAACDSGSDPVDPPITDAERQFNLLKAHTWKAGTITKDGNALKDDYPYFADFTITFDGDLNSDKSNMSPGTYDTSDPGEVLPDGTWTFKEGAISSVLIMNNMEVEYVVTDNTLLLEFVRDPPANGRTEAISGQYRFDLIAQ